MEEKSNAFLERAPLGRLMASYSVPCIISMIPGVDAYNALLALLSISEAIDHQELTTNITLLFHSGMRAIGIIFAIAVGIAIPPLFFYRYRHTRL